MTTALELEPEEKENDEELGPILSLSPSPQKRLSEGGRPGCQFFVMATPRPSTESPRRCRLSSSSICDGFYAVSAPVGGGADENTDHNAGGADPVTTNKAKPTAGAAKNPSVDYSRQPCLRPATPPKSKPLGRQDAGSPLPSRRGFPTTLFGQTSPEHQDEIRSQHSFTHSVGEVSIGSVESRVSQLSRRTFSKRTLSSQELEQMAVEQKKQQVKDMMKRNRLSCRKALTPCMSVGTAGRGQCSMKVTIPKEFSLSAPPTPKGRCRDLSDNEESSVRRPTPNRRGTPAAPSSPGAPATSAAAGTGTRPRSRQPTPERSRPLCVPQGPQLRTASRGPERRRSLSCPPSQAVSELLGPGASSSEAAETPSKAPKGAAGLQRGTGAASARRPLTSARTPGAAAEAKTPEERAQRAQRRKEEEHQRSNNAYVFKRRPAPGAAGSTSRVGAGGTSTPTAPRTGAGPTSARSTTAVTPASARSTPGTTSPMMRRTSTPRTASTSAASTPAGRTPASAAAAGRSSQATA